MESNRINEALEKWFKKEFISQERFEDEYGDEGDAFRALRLGYHSGHRKGKSTGYKKGRVDTLNDVAIGIDSDDSNESFRNELREYIDTELKKAGE